MTIFKGNTPLTTLTEWEKLAGPKSANQWVDGRSAKEAARAWLEGGGTVLPPEVAAVLEAHPSFGPVQSWKAEPEAKLPFDQFQGEPRNSDLVVSAVDSHGAFILAVEAKADEPFGETVCEALVASLERYLGNDRSKGIDRIQQLAKALMGAKRAGDPPVGDLRYQLLTACAGALAEAERQGCPRALLLVHEFLTDKTEDEKHRRNAEDLNAFAHRLSHGAVTNIGHGEIVGPLTVPGAPLVPPAVQLFLGKVSRDLRTNTH
jgi:hypothetical protein